MPPPKAYDVADEVCYLSGRQLGVGHALVAMGVREECLQGLGSRIRPIGHIVKAWRVMRQKRLILLVRGYNVAHIAFTERQTVPLLRPVSTSGLLLCAGCGGHQADKYGQAADNE